MNKQMHTCCYCCCIISCCRLIRLIHSVHTMEMQLEVKVASLSFTQETMAICVAMLLMNSCSRCSSATAGVVLWACTVRASASVCLKLCIHGVFRSLLLPFLWQRTSRQSCPWQPKLPISLLFACNEFIFVIWSWVRELESKTKRVHWTT